MRRITRAALITVSGTLWDNVLGRYRFSTAGAAQLHADLAAICRVVNKQVGPGVAEAGLRRCLEGARLVGLPVRGGKDQSARTEAAEGAGGDEDWEAWGKEMMVPRRRNRWTSACGRWRDACLRTIRLREMFWMSWVWRC
jgi:hypothetical protein